MNRHNDDIKNKVQVPVNTRAVGEPSGSYLLYLEDYVHTFVRKIYEEGQKNGREGEVTLYGYEFEEQGRDYLIVSGAVDKEMLQTSGERFFPSCYFLGEAKVKDGQNMQTTLEITLQNGRKLILDDYYIYYDQNEEMQNYLIEWNLLHNKGRIRNEDGDSAHLGRMIQAYNKEEVRVNYLWNAMNLLSLGLIVCIMAFGIICVNNYHKMKDMESKIAFVLSLPEEALAAMNQEIETDKQVSAYEISSEEALEEETDSVQNGMTDSDPALKTDQEIPASAETAMQEPETDVQLSSQDSLPAETDSAIQTAGTGTDQANQEETLPAQYYVVQQGDTLRSISFRIYGTYSKVPEICEWNGIEDADSILYGQKLLLH